ncbi:MAG: sigma-70 family RNA polymerase sigma factor [Marinovum algicola]|uniref:RNA polymerase sigma factor n=1 Tax=Marinovum algicola TaxID=42444 RepID=A0A975WAS3_9RHOB|nr:sigma-70 family RNA polymerase sigma factor [Marinovum algicola]AKO95490.1 RNA polymerase sigma factor, sigma-70 family [Marinovum algicola DG 898]SEJ63799.1 RNA polymerase sigma-70 factor, ECF subfamily [Marinovum algicola]SLN52751.1 ECF RNA polymerase sigma factor SigR [Marinovum algicola]
MGAKENIVEMIPALRAYAWVLTRRHEDVDDLVQDTLVKAIDNFDKYQSGTNLRAWLMTIMRNTFLNNVKRAARMQTGAETCISSSVSVPATQEWTVRGHEMMDKVAELPTHYRETLILVVMLGESYETAARICEVEVGTIKSRVNRARRMLIAALEGNEPEGVKPPSD